MMKEVVEMLPAGTPFSKGEFCEVVRSLKPGYADSSISWLLKKMQDAGLIASVGRGRYVRVSDGTKGKYKYKIHSDDFVNIERIMAERFPLLTFQMWELDQMNEFMNHQMFASIIVVEVEHMAQEAVFEFLRESYTNVLFCPGARDYYFYRGYEVTVIVQRLVTEAPRPIQGHDCPIEKILVDICTKGLTSLLIPKSEYVRIFEDAFHCYVINKDSLLRYARRRNVESIVRKYMAGEPGVSWVEKP